MQQHNNVAYTLPSAQNAALHQPSHQAPPPAFCMPVLPIPKSEMAKRRLSTPGTSSSAIQHPSAPPPQGQPPQPHAGTAISHGQGPQGRPQSAYVGAGVQPHTRVTQRPQIPDLKVSSRATSVMFSQTSPTGGSGELNPQAPSPVTAALISPRQLAPNPTAPATLHPYRQLSQPQLPPPPIQAPPLPPSGDLAPPPAPVSFGSGGISPRGRSYSAAEPSAIKTPEQMMVEIENLTRQLQMAREENSSLSSELAKAKERINELTAQAEGKKKKKREKNAKLKEEKAKRKEMDKLDREEEKRRKEKEKEDKKEKEEREKKEKEEKEKKEKEEKERKEKEEKQAKKEAKKKVRVETEEKEKEKKAKKKKDKESEGKDKKKKGSKREKKSSSKEGSQKLDVGAPKAGAWVSKATSDAYELPYGSVDTPPPSREILMAENKRALEIIEDSRTTSYTNETLAEIDELVRQEEKDIDNLLQPIAGLERMVLVYEKSGELDLKRNAEEELQQKKEVANLKGYVVANLLNKKAVIQRYIEQPEAASTSSDGSISHDLPPPPPETPRNPILLSVSGGVIREPPRPPSAQIADTSFLSGAPPSHDPPAPNKEDELFPDATYLIGLYPFAGTGVDEMPITEGDRIRLIEKLSDTWWKGANRGVIGLFPANYTRVERPHEKVRFATALYDRDSKGTADQLSFHKGAHIRLLDSPEESDEWVKGRLEDDTVGWLPKAYIHIHE